MYKDKINCHEFRRYHWPNHNPNRLHRQRKQMKCPFCYRPPETAAALSCWANYIHSRAADEWLAIMAHCNRNYNCHVGHLEFWPHFGVNRQPVWWPNEDYWWSKLVPVWRPFTLYIHTSTYWDRSVCANISKSFTRILQGRTASKSSLNKDEGSGSTRKRDKEREHEFRMKNRRNGDAALIDALSAFYAKLLVVLGVAFPVTDILSWRAPTSFYQGFYLYLYLGSVGFVAFMYVAHLRTRALFSMIDSYRK